MEEAPDSEILKDWLEFRGNPPLIPVLQRADLNIPLFLKLEVETLDIIADEYKRKYGLEPDDVMYVLSSEDQEALLEDLNHKEALSKESHVIDLSKSQHPFNGEYVIITKDYQVKKFEGGSLDNDTGKYFLLRKLTI